MERLASEYNVAFVYTAEAGGYEGVRTWTSFESKEDFDAWYTPDIRSQQEVLEEGVSPERAVELCEQTPMMSYVGASMADATRADGSVDLDIAAMKLEVVAFALDVESSVERIPARRVRLGC